MVSELRNAASGITERLLLVHTSAFYGLHEPGDTRRAAEKHSGTIMSMRRGIPAFFLFMSSLLGTTLTFEGIPDSTPVGQYYSGLGISFADGIALIERERRLLWRTQRTDSGTVYLRSTHRHTRRNNRTGKFLLQ